MIKEPYTTTVMLRVTAEEVRQICQQYFNSKAYSDSLGSDFVLRIEDETKLFQIKSIAGNRCALEIRSLADITDPERPSLHEANLEHSEAYNGRQAKQEGVDIQGLEVDSGQTVCFGQGDSRGED